MTALDGFSWSGTGHHFRESALGAGTNVAIESADVVLVRSNPLDIFDIIGLSRATYRRLFESRHSRILRSKIEPDDELLKIL